jgi:DNA-binding SARP family transcriptional activator
MAMVFESARRIIRRKVTQPPRAPHALERLRIVRHLSELTNSHAVLLVRAGPGAGKTTAVVDWCAYSDHPVAWLTVDESDRAPGRLLTYLQAALSRVCQLPADLVQALLSTQVPHTEVAGILADSVAGSGVCVVIDDAERLLPSTESVDVLGAFARYLPDDCRLVLLSQVYLPLDLGGTAGRIRQAAVNADILAFNAEEAKEALERVGIVPDDIDELVTSTGGWVAAVMFSASAGSVDGAQRPNVDLEEHLGEQILARLSAAERAFVVRTSILDEITVERARALGFSHAGQLLATLRTAHLPATWSGHGESVRLHPFLREHLRRVLEREEPAEIITALRSRYGRLLVLEGEFELAAAQFLAAGDATRMSAAIERALPEIVQRLDFEVALGWLETLRRAGMPPTPATVLAELLLAMGKEQYWKVVDVADGMSPSLFEAAVVQSPTAATVVSWCYWHLGRPNGAERVYRKSLLGMPSREAAVARAMFGLSEDRGPVDLPSTDAAHVGPLDPLIPRIAYYCGRFRFLERAVLDSPWAGRVGAAWYVGALRATGRTEEALSLYERTAHDGTSVWLHAIAYPEALLDRGSRSEAWAALQRGRELVESGGSRVHQVMSLLLEGKFHLRFDRHPARVREVLGRIDAVGPAASYAFLREERLTLLAEAALVDGEVDLAIQHSSAASSSMRAAGRLLHLPRTQVLLSEALWRKGDESGSIEAADRALTAALEQGSNFLLLQALADFPDVLARSMDGESSGDAPWHALGRDLLVPSSRGTARPNPAVYLHDFGPLEMRAGGEVVRPRIRKSLELVAFLITQPEGAARRDAVLDALFEGRNNASSRAYLRQAVHQMREVLRDKGADVVVEDSLIRLAPDNAFGSDSRWLADLLRGQRFRQREARLQLLQEVVELAARGPYLSDVTSSWPDSVRTRIDQATNTARYDAAVLAYRLGRYRDADRLVSELLAMDPYREKAWVLAIELAGSLGDPDRALSIFRRCQEALAELGLQPSADVLRSLQAVRR